MPEEGPRVRIEGARDGDLAEILRDFERFWGDSGFEKAARERGAVALKAITNPENEASVAFHQRLGFTEMARFDDYGGSGRPRVVMRKPLMKGGR